MNRITGIEGHQTPAKHPEGKVSSANTKEGFREVLAEIAQASNVKFSKHALERISARGVSLDRVSLQKLGDAVDVASSKGANESLVLMDELALIVSVKNRTVITAMASGDTRGNVFTAIDSAIIA